MFTTRIVDILLFFTWAFHAVERLKISLNTESSSGGGSVVLVIVVDGVGVGLGVGVGGGDPLEVAHSLPLCSLLSSSSARRFSSTAHCTGSCCTTLDLFICWYKYWNTNTKDTAPAPAPHGPLDPKTQLIYIFICWYKYSNTNTNDTAPAPAPHAPLDPKTQLIYIFICWCQQCWLNIQIQKTRLILKLSSDLTSNPNPSQIPISTESEKTAAAEDHSVTQVWQVWHKYAQVKRVFSSEFCKLLAANRNTSKKSLRISQMRNFEF